jgi:hypothetical protein
VEFAIPNQAEDAIHSIAFGEGSQNKNHASDGRQGVAVTVVNRMSKQAADRHAGDWMLIGRWGWWWLPSGRHKPV